MIRTAAGILGLVALLPALQSGDKKPKTPTPAQQYQALVKEYQKAEIELKRRRDLSKGSFGKQNAAKEEIQQPEKKFPPLFLELAEKNPKDPVAVDSLAWIVTHVRLFKTVPANPRSQAMKILLRDHVQSEKMADLCPALGDPMDQQGHHLLRAVLEKNKHRRAQAQACRALAWEAEFRLHVALSLKDTEAAKRSMYFYEQIGDKETAEALVNGIPEKIREEAATYYNRIVKEFADVTDARGHKLGDAAKERLDALPQLIAIGKPAPEIEGKDIDGDRLKLSDYRGKVVLLFFWANTTRGQDIYAHERALVKRLEGKPFVLIGVNSTHDRADLKKFIESEKITWRSFWYGGHTESGIVSRWQVQQWPTLFLIDAKGIIRHKHVVERQGSPGEKGLDAEVDKLIAEVEKTAEK
jgi:peroxiredoxin